MSRIPRVEAIATGAPAGGPGGSPTLARNPTAEAEYRALTQGVALLDRSAFGRLSISGQDALDLLNRLTTNELAGLEPGKGVPTVLTSNKGRIVDLLHVFLLRDRLVVLTSPDARQTVADWIDFYTIMEDVAVEDPTAETAMLSVAGPNAAGLLDELTGVSSLERYEYVEATASGAKAGVYRTDFLGLPAYDIVVDAALGGRLRAEILQDGRRTGVTPVGAEAVEVVRIERGVPAFGKELGERYNPLEANLLELISFTKGCYVGQEVVARLNTYRKVKKQLVGLQWALDVGPGADAELTFDGKQVGVVTSAARSPRLGKGIGLGYVRKAQAVPGTPLAVEAPDAAIEVEVVELPR